MYNQPTSVMNFTFHVYQINFQNFIHRFVNLEETYMKIRFNLQKFITHGNYKHFNLINKEIKLIKQRNIPTYVQKSIELTELGRDLIRMSNTPELKNLNEVQQRKTIIRNRLAEIKKWENYLLNINKFKYRVQKQIRNNLKY